jgi:hypothetical protein
VLADLVDLGQAGTKHAAEKSPAVDAAQR